ncbi:TadE/TadG family type IV pilus assembly protein [Chloroflexota bacterium]
MKNNKSSGQSLVELALTLPMLLLLVIGVFDLGRGIYYYSAIHNAAREGARYGSVNRCDKEGIKVRAREMAIGLDIEIEDEDISLHHVPETDPPQLDFIKVTVRYPFEIVTPLVGAFFGDSGAITLMSEARQVIEIPLACP